MTSGKRCKDKHYLVSVISFIKAAGCVCMGQLMVCVQVSAVQ